jgi:hypothetical protein
MRNAGHDTPAPPSFLVKNQKHTRQPRPPERAWFRASAAQQHCQLSCAQLFACFFFRAWTTGVREKKSAFSRCSSTGLLPMSLCIRPAFFSEGQAIGDGSVSQRTLFFSFFFCRPGLVCNVEPERDHNALSVYAFVTSLRVNSSQPQTSVSTGISKARMTSYIHPPVSNTAMRSRNSVWPSDTP